MILSLNKKSIYLHFSLKRERKSEKFYKVQDLYFKNVDKKFRKKMWIKRGKKKRKKKDN